jgi:hypothetical protein
MDGRRTRFFAGLLIALFGSLIALAYGGGSVGQCLGPLVVTAVRCAAHGGGIPTTGAVGAQLIVAWCAGLLTVVGLPRITVVVGGALAGAALGATAYHASRPLVLEGADFDGSWLSIPLPVEPWSMAIWAIAGGLLALVGLRLISVLPTLVARRRRTR